MTKIIILDTSALLYLPLSKGKGERHITTYSVIKEIYKDEIKKAVIDAYIQTNILKVVKPKKKYIVEALRKAREIGEHRLSKADVEVLALAIQLRGEGAIVFTDDYAIQNILHINNIPYLPVRRQIKRKLKWTYQCEACGETYNSETEICEKCGSKVVRIGKY